MRGSPHLLYSCSWLVAALLIAYLRPAAAVALPGSCRRRGLREVRKRSTYVWHDDGRGGAGVARRERGNDGASFSDLAAAAALAMQGSQPYAPGSTPESRAAAGGAAAVPSGAAWQAGGAGAAGAAGVVGAGRSAAGASQAHASTAPVAGQGQPVSGMGPGVYESCRPIDGNCERGDGGTAATPPGQLHAGAAGFPAAPGGSAAPQERADAAAGPVPPQGPSAAPAAAHYGAPGMAYGGGAAGQPVSGADQGAGAAPTHTQYAAAASYGAGAAGQPGTGAPPATYGDAARATYMQPPAWYGQYAAPAGAWPAPPHAWPPHPPAWQPQPPGWPPAHAAHAWAPHAWGAYPAAGAPPWPPPH